MKKSEDNKKSIKKNFFYNLLYEFVIILSPLIVTPYVSRKLGVELIGVRSYTYAILTYFELFVNLGIAVYGQREVAKNLFDKKKRSNIFFSLLCLKFFAFLIVLTIYLVSFVGMGILDKYKIIWIIWIIHLSESLFNVTWYFQGIERFKLISIRGIILRTLQIILTLTLIKSPSDFYLYLIIYATIPTLQAISLWPFLKKEIDWTELKNVRIKNHLKNVFIFFIPTIATTIYSNVDKIMLGSLLETTTQAGYYESAQSIALLATTIFTSIYTVMRSRISAEVAEGNTKDIGYFTQFSLFMVFAITLGIFSVSGIFITVFYGSDYMAVIPLLRYFCAIIFLVGISGFISAVYIVPYDKQKYISIFYVFATLVNVILNAYLIPKLEAFGAIIGSIAAEGVVFIGCIVLSRKVLNFTKYIKYGWKYFISGIFMFLVVYPLDMFLSKNIFSLTCEIIIGSVVYLITLYSLKDSIVRKYIDIKIKDKNNKEVIR